MGCEKLNNEYYEDVRSSQMQIPFSATSANLLTSQTSRMRFVNAIDKKIPFTYDACEFRENSFFTTKITNITKNIQTPASYAKLSSLSCPQRKMQSLRTSQTINGLIPANYAKSTSIMKNPISYYGEVFQVKLGLISLEI